MNTVNAIRNSRDKLMTKTLLTEAGVRTPRLLDVGEVVSGEVTSPFVVKNRFGFGAKGMSAHRSVTPTELVTLKNKLRNPRYFTEELVECER